MVGLIGYLPKWLPHKYIILGGLTLSIVATILLPFGDSPSRYWRFDFPAQIISTIGMMIIYANSNIAIFAYTPPSVAGTVGAVFNSALQLGSAVGLAAVASLTTSLDEKVVDSLSPPLNTWPVNRSSINQEMWKRAFKGRAASFWFLLGILGVETIAVTLLFKVDIHCTFVARLHPFFQSIHVFDTNLCGWSWFHTGILETSLSCPFLHREFDFAFSDERSIQHLSSELTP